MVISMDALPFTVEQKAANVLVVRTDISSVVGWEQWHLFSSDRHHDNCRSLWDLEKRHLEEAKERRAGIFDFGDLFCAMQGKYDKRSDLSQCRPEHQQGRYLDELVTTAADFYNPYAWLWVLLGIGNHELSILKKHETHLTERLAERLRVAGSSVCVGGTAGWVRFTFVRGGAQYQSFRMYYHHGYGGGGPVTRGVIHTNRMAVYLPDADIVVSGHTHDAYDVPIARLRLSDRDVEKLDEQVHLRCPGYKEESVGGQGWHVETGKPPKPLGAYWLHFYWQDEQIKFETVRAK